jgi:hypothetical protein
MLVSVALTVVLAMSYTSKTDLQLSKLEEENQKALAAAEAGIEALVGSTSNTQQIKDLPNLSDFTGSAEKTLTTGKLFVTPNTQKLSQYVFYLADYPDLNNSYTGRIRMFYENNENGQCDTTTSNALEITIISGNNQPYTINRFVSDGGKRLRADNDGIYNASVTETIDNVVFICRTGWIDINSYSNAKLLVIRPIFKSTKVGIEGNNDLKSQGTVITSEAKTPSGVSKKIQLFQSYPQIPAEFFVTSF